MYKGTHDSNIVKIERYIIFKVKKSDSFFWDMYLIQISLLTLTFLFFQFENLVESDEVSISTVVQNPYLFSWVISLILAIIFEMFILLSLF